MGSDDSLPTDLASAHALIIAQRAVLNEAQREAQYRALLIEQLKNTIRKLRHERFGQSSERSILLDQLELQCQRASKSPRLWASNFPLLTGLGRAGDQPFSRSWVFFPGGRPRRFGAGGGVFGRPTWRGP